MVLPRPTARITHAAKLEFFSRDRSENRGARQLELGNGIAILTLVLRRKKLNWIQTLNPSQRVALIYSWVSLQQT
jgi:hypothetical protein